MRSCDPACSTSAGVAAIPNRAARRPPWSKKKGRPWCLRARSRGRPASSTIFAAFECFSAQAISASRRPSTNSRSRLSAWLASGFTRVPAAAMSVPSGNRMSRSTTIAGSNIRLRCSRAGAMSGTGCGSSSPDRARDRASRSIRASSPERCIAVSRASISSSRSASAMGQVAPRTPRSFADAGPDAPRTAASASAARGRNEAGKLMAPLRGTGHGRTVADPSPGSDSSGPTSDPSRPSQGRSGSTTARPRMRARGTRPISA